MNQPEAGSAGGEWGFWQRLTRRKLRNYLFLDKKLQFNIALLLVVVGAFNVLYFSMLFYFYSEHIFLIMAQLIPEYALTEKVLDEEYKIFWRTIAFAGAFEVVLVLLLGLFFSHRIAGPLYAMSGKLRQIARREVPNTIRLRKDDLLLTFADRMNEAIQTLQTQRGELISAMKEADAGDLESLRSRLKKLTTPETEPESPSTDGGTPRGSS